MHTIASDRNTKHQTLYSVAKQKVNVKLSLKQADRRLSAKLVSTFAKRGCHVVSVTDPYGSVLGFLHLQVAPQLYSRD
jgi:hypothetical protein